MNFPHEREKLFNLLHASGRGGIVVLSGDRHRGEISRMDGALDYPLYDLTSSGLNMAWVNGPPEENRHRVSDLCDENNFGLVSIDWSETTPSVTLELHSMRGETLASESVDLGSLQP